MYGRRLGALSACALALALPCAADADKPIPGQYIVVLHDGTDAGAVAAEHKRKDGAEVLDTYGAALDGYTARLSDSELRQVQADPRVESVVQDREGSPLHAQTFPTFVNRIDAEAGTQASGNGSGTAPGDVAIFDTGIQVNHPDLNVVGGVNCLGTATSSDGTFGDENGHGTHVAGIVGAKDDAVGTVGVAPGVRLWSVRVLNGFPTGTTSSQLCGIDWVTANGPSLGIKVVNASMALFGAADDGNCGYTNGAVLHQAICRSTAAGILWVFSAGNNSGATIATNAGGGLDEVLAVTATADSNGTPNVGSTSSFTCPVLNGTRKSPNSGAEVDDKHASFATYAVTAADQAHTIAAPGACIWSTYKGSTYGNLSGSSMAAPQVTAVAHLCITGGQCPGTPAQTIQKLRADAQVYTQANPGYGFAGDPLRPVTGKYFGYLVRAALY